MLNDTSKKEKKKLQTTIRRIREDAEKNVMEKNIVEVLNVNGKIMEKGLVLNKSYDIFNLNEDVSKYERLAHTKNHFEDPHSFDSYEIEIHGYNIAIESEDGKVDSITCSESCVYNGQELIMMKIEDFLKIIKEVPTDHNIYYLSGSHQNQHVYDFDESGLQVWVWRGKIRTIIIYDTHAYEE